MKSREQRQREAIERKSASLPVLIGRLRGCVAAMKEAPGCKDEAERAVRAEQSLARTYVEIGRSREEAEGMARAIALGSAPGAWVSGLSQGARAVATRAAEEPSSIQAVLERVEKLVPGCMAVCLVPHPFRRAIQVRADGPVCDGSMIADMEILELDALGAAFKRAGMTVFRRESDYMAHLTGTTT